MEWQTWRSVSKTEEDHEEEIEAARKDPNAFIEFCFGKEDGTKMVQAEHHREWQSLFDEPRVALLGSAELGKTLQTAFRLVFDLGQNTELRTFVISAQIDAASKIVGVVKRAIEENERVRMVFPDLLPSTPWNTTTLLVKRKHGSTVKDFSLQAYGYRAKFLGIRADRMVVDDINDNENSRTEYQRQEIVKWFDLKVQTRLMTDGKVWATGNAWHKQDLLHTLAGREGFTFARYACLKEGTLEPTWPAQFPLSRIAAIRRNLPPLSFARAYMCLCVSDEVSKFEEHWFDDAKERGVGVPYSPKHTPMGEDERPLQIYVGVDLASGNFTVAPSTGALPVVGSYTHSAGTTTSSQAMAPPRSKKRRSAPR